MNFKLITKWQLQLCMTNQRIGILNYSFFCNNCNKQTSTDYIIEIVIFTCSYLYSLFFLSARHLSVSFQFCLVDFTINDSTQVRFDPLYILKMVKMNEQHISKTTTKLKYVITIELNPKIIFKNSE